MNQEARQTKSVSTVVTFMEMNDRPTVLMADFPDPTAIVAQEGTPSIAFYRYIYDVVGRDYLWVNRKWWSDEKLAKTIHDEAVEIHCLYVGDQIAGFSEIDFRLIPDVEITFFGLMPDFIGRGLSKPFLQSILQRAWRKTTTRVHLQTCTCDHPAALPLYQKAGFVAYGRTTETLTPL